DDARPCPAADADGRAARRLRGERRHRLRVGRRPARAAGQGRPGRARRGRDRCGRGRRRLLAGGLPGHLPPVLPPAGGPRRLRRRGRADLLGAAVGPLQRVLLPAGGLHRLGPEPDGGRLRADRRRLGLPDHRARVGARHPGPAGARPGLPGRRAAGRLPGRRVDLRCRRARPGHDRARRHRGAGPHPGRRRRRLPVDRRERPRRRPAADRVVQHRRPGRGGRLHRRL
ncbi:MAG: hypothetical protein AVDCRST_MAG41-1753, partial [uncultured Corynebacteriales bacterium]